MVTGSDPAAMNHPQKWTEPWLGCGGLSVVGGIFVCCFLCFAETVTWAKHFWRLLFMSLSFCPCLGRPVSWCDCLLWLWCKDRFVSIVYQFNLDKSVMTKQQTTPRLLHVSVSFADIYLKKELLDASVSALQANESIARYVYTRAHAKCLVVCVCVYMHL